MERVNHVHIIEIGCSRLICYVDGMLKREIPDGECLEFGITCLYSVFLLLIELAQADSHLAAAGSRGSHHNERTCSNHIVVTSESLIGIYKGNVVGITLYGVMNVGHYAQTLKTLAESIGTGLTVIVGNHHRSDQKATGLELLTQTQHIHIVGNTQITAYLVLFNIQCTDYDNNLGTVTELHKHTQLTVRLETGQNAAGVMVIEEFSSELEVKFVTELSYALLDVFGLYPKILFVVKSVYHNGLQT